MSDDRGVEEVAYRLDVRLAILGSCHDYTKINEILGVEANHYARKGQSVEGRPIARQNVWSYRGDVPRENAEIDEQWKPIGQLIARRQTEIAALGLRAKVQIAVVAVAFSTFPGIVLTPDMIAQINSIGASLDVDLYGSLTGEVY